MVVIGWEVHKAAFLDFSIECRRSVSDTRDIRFMTGMGGYGVEFGVNFRPLDCDRRRTESGAEMTFCDE